VRVRIPPPAQDPERSIDTRTQAFLRVRMGSSSQRRSAEKKGAGWSKGLTAATDERVRRMALARLGQPNWAKGLTAANDPRVAKQAAARRGQHRGPYRLVRRAKACGVLPVTTQRERAYAYVLGMYLGDGHIARVGRTHALRVYLDIRYPRIAERCAAAMAELNPFHCVRIRRRGTANVLVVSACGQCWPELFPQHGPGRKHTRPIVLLEWQREIVTREPMSFLRGLVESDGCRYFRHVDGHDYGAYNFVNRSQDILRLCCWACDLLGVGYTRPNEYTISIARRANVARLDEEFGPKS
jgi:hypothetical protein